jgi:hypothetical protein
MTLFPITTRPPTFNDEPSTIVWVNPNMIRSIQVETWTVKSTDSYPARTVQGTLVTVQGINTKLITEESTDSIIHRIHQL